MARVRPPTWIHRALETGIDVIDTADVYGLGGESERIVCKALKGRREK